MALKRTNPRQQKLERTGAALGAVLGAVTGFPFGYWFIPNVGFVTAITGKLDPLGSGIMFAWLLAMAGVWGGKLAGTEWFVRIRASEKRDERRKRYADVIADHEAYAAREAEREREAAKRASAAKQMREDNEAQPH